MSEKTYPSLDEAKTYARDFRSVPVSRTILSDIRTPVEEMRALKRSFDPKWLLGVGNLFPEKEGV